MYPNFDPSPSLLNWNQESPIPFIPNFCKSSPCNWKCWQFSTNRWLKAPRHYRRAPKLNPFPFWKMGSWRPISRPYTLAPSSSTSLLPVSLLILLMIDRTLFFPGFNTHHFLSLGFPFASCSYFILFCRCTVLDLQDCI